MATILAFAQMAFPVSMVFAEDSLQSLGASLFSPDEDVLANNSAAASRHASTLPPEERFDYLADWVLPSTTHSAIRMNGEFTQTDPAPVGQSAGERDDIRGGVLVSPVFDLLELAKSIDRLPELLQAVEAISESTVEEQLRARAALLVLIHVVFSQPGVGIMRMNSR